MFTPMQPSHLLHTTLISSISPPVLTGSPLMSAPSSVETSTSTGSGDWLNREGRGLSTGPSLSAGFRPALRSHTDDPPALKEPLSEGH